MFSPFYFIRMDDLEKQILDFRWKTKGSVEAGFTLAAKKTRLLRISFQARLFILSVIQDAVILGPQMLHLHIPL